MDMLNNQMVSPYLLLFKSPFPMEIQNQAYELGIYHPSLWDFVGSWESELVRG